MRYRQIEAPEHLKRHIQYFWTLNSDLFDLTTRRFGPLADGCPGIIVQRKENGTYYDEDRNTTPTFFIWSNCKTQSALLSGPV